MYLPKTPRKGGVWPIWMDPHGRGCSKLISVFSIFPKSWDVSVGAPLTELYEKS